MTYYVAIGPDQLITMSRKSTSMCVIYFHSIRPTFKLVPDVSKNKTTRRYMFFCQILCIYVPIRVCLCCKIFKKVMNGFSMNFYPRDAMLARVFAIATCPSVCLSVCHTPVLCLAERKQDREMYTI